MNEIITIEKEDISSKIYEIRGVQVMLSSDVARLYKTETKIINQTIKRNIMRFPESFCFQLTNKEYDYLKSQFVTSSSSNDTSHGGVRFRKWATARIKKYIIKGFTMDDECLKNLGGGKYFYELLNRIKDIRSSEKVLYR